MQVIRNSQCVSKVEFDCCCAGACVYMNATYRTPFVRLYMQCIVAEQLRDNIHQKVVRF